MKLSRLATLAAILALTPACLAAPSAAPELKTDDEKAIYALGVILSNNIAAFSLTPAELEILKAGITDGVLKNDKKVDPDSMRAKLQELAKTRAEALSVAENKAGKEFLAKIATEPGCEKSGSGLIYESVKEGTGESPKATDKVKVHYTGTLIDGTVFDSSVKRGEPIDFALNGVIPCWTEGVQKMKVGGKAKLYCPSDLAYGERGAPPLIKPGATLVFEVELLEIVTN